MKGSRKTDRVMVNGVKYRIVPAGPCCPHYNCEGCVGQHDLSLCMSLPDCQSPRECAYVAVRRKVSNEQG